MGGIMTPLGVKKTSETDFHQKNDGCAGNVKRESGNSATIQRSTIQDASKDTVQGQSERTTKCSQRHTADKGCDYAE